MMNHDDNSQIKEALESIVASDSAKERMFANIKRKAEAQPTPSGQTSSHTITRKSVWMKWAAMAACFALIVMAAVIHQSKSGTQRPPVYRDGIIGGTHGVNDYMPASAAPMDDYVTEEAVPAYRKTLNGAECVISELELPAGEYEAGMLTAGEWKDAEAMAEWVKKLSENSEWAAFVKQRGLNSANFVKVTVTDGDKKCFNAKVELTDGENTLFTARTDINGCTYLFYSINGENSTPVQIKVGNTVESVNANTEITIDATGAGLEVNALDLMLMIDTTGSMGDELEYLKAELADMVERISKENDALSIRVSVNFYRDKGDEYVVKYFDFRDDINECLDQLKQQSANGGGDYPEAVHTALENAVSDHTWRENAVKLCFMVLDAPPHSEQQVQGVNTSLRNSVLKAAELGIRLIPVASSGVDDETEFLLRSYSLMTGGTYVFLTNDSGIGFSHKDPDINEDVTVELLNDCMVRIACEYCGIYSGEKVPYTPPEPEYHQ